MFQGFLPGRMKKPGGVTAGVFALLFLAAQMIALHHAGEFGKDQHQHNGELCTISLFTDRNDTGPAADSTIVESLVTRWSAYQHPSEEPSVDAPASPYASRAPPHSVHA